MNNYFTLLLTAAFLIDIGISFDLWLLIISIAVTVIIVVLLGRITALRSASWVQTV